MYNEYTNKDLETAYECLRTHLGGRFQWRIMPDPNLDASGRVLNVGQLKYQTSISAEDAAALAEIFNLNPQLDGRTAYRLPDKDQSDLTTKSIEFEIPFTLINEKNFGSYEPEALAEKMRESKERRLMERVRAGEIDELRAPDSSFPDRTKVVCQLLAAHTPFVWEKEGDSYVTRTTPEEAHRLSDILEKSGKFEAYGISYSIQKINTGKVAVFSIPSTADTPQFWQSLPMITTKDMGGGAIRDTESSASLDPATAAIERQLRQNPRAVDPAILDIEKRWQDRARQNAGSKDGTEKPGGGTPGGGF